MTPQEIAELLRRVPEKRLRIFGLARQCLGAEGDLDFAMVASLTGEMDDAMEEAEAYIAAVQSLRTAFARLTQAP